MFVEQPPLLYRLLFPEAIWRIKHRDRKVVYLTFDDGPIPEVTPWVLDQLDHYGIKATFFMVGDNVRRNPWLLDEVRRRGHSYGNHTMHHLQGMKVESKRYLDDIEESDRLIASPLFRPPHGILRWKQARAVKQRYNLIMYDVVSRDYSRRLGPEQVVDNVRRHARNGSIIVFHDSLKAWRNVSVALPRVIEWLKSEGYEFLPLPM
ncbi:MAG: polysaccharide deacetylase family protein [Muribaculaceae bacterium]|nr:polysaccharide deacetylase family protein [Muribaculaceae bacterium]MDE6332554.1 polysaccharide deacetylase family protein [Muribaculaceae bacterium]